MPFGRERAAGMLSLEVDDLAASAAFYRNVLGFDQLAMLGGLPPTVAIMSRFGVLLLLQSSTGLPGSRSEPRATGARPPGPPWDAVLLVPDVAAAHRDMVTRRVPEVGSMERLPIGWEYFEVSDDSGNRICFGDSSLEFMSRNPSAPVVPFARPRARLRELRSRRQERSDLAAFREFQASIADRRDVFYMFFTSGLLHWAARAASFVPPDVELVLVGSALTADERDWIGEHIDRPFHHIALPVDDVTVWEFLFRTSPHNFGWIDIDCFVLDERVFTELTALDPGHAMNCTWSWDSGYGFPIANTHLLFVNVAAIRAVAAMGVEPSPCTYDWYGSSRRFGPRKCFMRVPSARERDLLLQLLPADARGRPQLLFGDYYDTTVLFQLLARVAGFPVQPIRNLVRRCSAQPDELSLSPDDWPEDISDELFHLYGVSYYDKDDNTSHLRALYLAAEVAVLDAIRPPLPPHYRERREALAAELSTLAVDPQDARSFFQAHLTEVRGLSGSSVDRMLPAIAPELS